MEQRNSVYLDQKFWNSLCDASMGIDKDGSSVMLLDRLRAGVATGKVICPLEVHVLVELFRQKLPEKRRATAEVIDSLSLGITIIPPPDRVFLETLRFSQAASRGERDVPAPRDEIWTKVAYVVGHGRLVAKGLPPNQSAALSDLFDEYLWSLPLVDVLDLMKGETPAAWTWVDRTAERLNAEKKEARHLFKSFDELYQSEVRGVLDAYTPILAEVMAHRYAEAGGTGDMITSAQRDAAGREFSIVLGNVMRLRDLTRQLPSVHVPAKLYASVQWDGERRYRPNDFADFGHAAAAVAYCDTFATERSLGALLDQSGLAALFKTDVVVSSADLLALLERQDERPPPGTH